MSAASNGRLVLAATFSEMGGLRPPKPPWVAGAYNSEKAFSSSSAFTGSSFRTVASPVRRA
jgi:hypothetical protein